MVQGSQIASFPSQNQNRMQSYDNEGKYSEFTIEAIDGKLFINYPDGNCESQPVKRVSILGC